jgi:putative endopeptidase
LVGQFDNFVVAGLKVNGIATLGENLADLGGVSVAFAAFQQWMSDNPTYKNSTRSLPFTPNQRFFLAYAQNRVESAREDFIKERLVSDVHSPGMLRVDGILRNLPEFHAAFNIKPGDDMYLDKEHRVTIWNLNTDGPVSSSIVKGVYLFTMSLIVSYCVI